MESFVQIRHEYAAVIKFIVADETQYIYMLPSDMIIKKSLTISLETEICWIAFVRKQATTMRKTN